MFIFVSIMHMIDCIAVPDEASSKGYVSVRKSIKYVMLYILKNICVILLDQPTDRQGSLKPKIKLMQKKLSQ